MRIKEQYKFQIANHYVCALAYGTGETDLNDVDIQKLAEFESMLPPIGLWAFGEESHFDIDEITGLYADCIDATYTAFE